MLDRTQALKELISLCEPYVEPSLGNPGSYQVINSIVQGTIGAAGAGDATVVMTASGLAGSPKTIQVPVANNDIAYQVATKLRSALTANADVNGFFEISGTGVNVTATSREYATNDLTMNLAISNGTCSGLTSFPTSDHVEIGSIPDTSELKTILDRHLFAISFQTSHVYVAGDKVVPVSPNGHKYLVVTGGISETEPTWPLTAIKPWWEVTSGAVIFREDGYIFETGYDIWGAAKEAWEKKAAKASQFVKTPGVDMSAIYDRCMKMSERFDTVAMA